MAWTDTVAILKNTAGDPVPQIWDDDNQEFIVYEGDITVDNIPTSIEVENTTGESLDVQVTGSDMEIYGDDTDKTDISPTVTGVAFVAIDTKKIYLWDGTAWVEFIDLS